MLVASTLGSPHNAFLLYFPITFHCNKVLGIRLLWIAAVSEWINTVLKWFLHGERPYWWVHVNGHNQLTQFSLTCETGPGSPSGHLMVSASVGYLLLIFAFEHPQIRVWSKAVLSTVFAMFLMLLCVSRCYIATHFPHQVVFGAVIGIIIADRCITMSVDHLTVKHYVLWSFVLLFAGVAIFYTLIFFGMDPFWSFYLAERWCSRPDWVHMDTSLLYALVRDASSLLGLGIGLHCRPPQSTEDHSISLLRRMVTIVLSVAVAQASRFIPIPVSLPILPFYSLVAAKIGTVIFLVVMAGYLAEANNSSSLKRN